VPETNRSATAPLLRRNLPDFRSFGHEATNIALRFVVELFGECRRTAENESQTKQRVRWNDFQVVVELPGDPTQFPKAARQVELKLVNHVQA
jgi:hypothetical protein